ncbi:biotin--[acetyl-CoA-carboxylase] ligase [Clostridium sp. LIBA-8841]|uniref:biotin--[acetyl-CoA-carboxylase] ligase n=1 Tax=Clostridium sp. LIBA-8841 TaxID=2987530 RepID=UPI002AC594F5|nr:biotin--[acetyl-CoA-carboxylase] ligase [Clostridium sp. LIBA-8841]MDZ5254175.1 biotin--[acetyl-CoA-carboxylase] ligase [Clostridium sp. LIBA-8841]
MSVKESVLKILEENRETSISGEELAKYLSVSRAAVWKAINALRGEGYNITAVTNRGYQLTKDNDLLSVEGIKIFLNPKYNENYIRVYKTIDSTNQEAKKILMDDDIPHGTVLISEEQTAGRGRFQRKFFSPSNKGIYMSVILRPNIELSKAIHITTSAAVSVCRAIENLTNKRPKIKWVNDIFLDGKKICGILTEATGNFESGRVENVVVGIGINFKTKEADFPDDIKDVAGSIFKGEEPNITRNQLVAEILNELLYMCDNLEDKSIMEEYKVLSFVLGKEVSFLKNNRLNKAKAIDISNEGALVVQYKNGELDCLNSGEISIKTCKK